MLAVTAAVFESAVILGVFLGTVYAMMALGIVASFRINRVVNLGIPGIAVSLSIDRPWHESAEEITNTEATSGRSAHAPRGRASSAAICWSRRRRRRPRAG